jgi:Carboxypeptidase regulatory-like domain
MSTIRPPNPLDRRAPARPWPKRSGWGRGASLLGLTVLWFAHCALASDDNASGKVEGTALVPSAHGQAYVAGAKVVASGPVRMETETNAEGRYAFRGMAPGTYSIEATVSGLEAVQSISVTSHQVAQVTLQLTPLKTNTSVTVTAGQADTKSPAATETITEKTLRDAPNVNERFASLLPIVPGVVRGPDGHINMKGARDTQSGALVNSANVTDPATGSPAINLPIDVVSSVQVTSNPYDPQYGRFTGALSSVETKTGDYERYHFSIQKSNPG